MSHQLTIRRRAIFGLAAATGGMVMVAAAGAAHAVDDGNAGIARRFFELLTAKDIDAWSQLWADDGRILVPYPPDGFASTIDGREAILAGFRDLFANFDTFTVDLTGVYPAADSDAVTVEYTVDARLRSNARYTNTNIAVFRFRGDKISEYHDYFDPRRFQLVVDEVARTGQPR